MPSSSGAECPESIASVEELEPRSAFVLRWEPRPQGRMETCVWPSAGARVVFGYPFLAVPLPLSQPG
ncbi:hypothetical protein WISP_95536 [Willisornis vidua]|uniref:Uncharacterized protein n=1 Tax=Willisornis vidua TaxID=1566151 RepID=A0ABQ9D500_9PASS|nr:hypothetical protein WISP_95536 [Willisornis vidua]